ncbi:MAG: DNA polymerase IV [Candidatus Omnitrophica bacterium]|nr:DNA polymerase IV [Candidatus Omnitrophota bacterium]
MLKYILHVDMDAFFAAVEQRDNPNLAGKPIIIGADPKKGNGRGVVSTCSYEARKFGIYSSLPISLAYKKCPQGVFLPVNMDKYHQASEEIYKIFYNFTPKVEPISIDEAFLDITGSFHLFGGPKKTCQALKDQIKKTTGLTASVGCAPTKMAAKIASDLEKPDGLVMVTESNLRDFLHPLEINKIWGLGKKSTAVFKERGIKTIGDLAEKKLETIIEIFGENGRHWWELAKGIDQRPVEANDQIKSISNEITFERDTNDKELIKDTLVGLSEKVSRRLRSEGLKARTITLKIRLKGYKTYTRSLTLIAATNFVDTIYKTARKLLSDFELKKREVRLLGVKASNCMDSEIKDSLFEGEKDKKKERVHQAVDSIRNKFGNQAIYRAKKTFLS